MAAATIISDSEAKRIARRFASLANGLFDRLARTGEIMTALADVAVRREGQEGRDCDLNALMAYVRHHGEREAVEGWLSDEGQTTWGDVI